MKRSLAGVILLGALILAGCSSISEGYITEKKHREGYYYTTTVCSGYKPMVCTPIIQYMPESWWFDLVEQTDGLNGKEPETGWVYVGPRTFDEYEVGDYYEEKK